MYEYTRQETIKLTGLSSGRLSYLDSQDLIKPYKVGNLKPQCYYSWQQLIELRLFNRLRENVSFQELRKGIEYLQSCEEKGFPNNKMVLAINSTIHWIDNNPDEYFKFMGKFIYENQGKETTLHTMFSMQDVIEDIKRLAKQYDIDLFNRQKLQKSNELVNKLAG